MLRAYKYKLLIVIVIGIALLCLPLFWVMNRIGIWMQYPLNFLSLWVAMVEVSTVGKK